MYFFPRLSGTGEIMSFGVSPVNYSDSGITSLTLCFPLLKCQMIVCPSSLHSCILGANFSPIRTPGEIMSFGVSPVNYSDTDSVRVLLRYIFFFFFTV